MNIRKDKYVPVTQLTEYNMQLWDKLQQQKLSQSTMSLEQSLQIQNYEKIQKENDQMIKFIQTIQRYEDALKQKDNMIAQLNTQLREKQKQMSQLQIMQSKTQEELIQKNQQLQEKDSIIQGLESKTQEAQQLQTKYDNVNQELKLAGKHLEELKNNIKQLQEHNSALETQLSAKSDKQQKLLSRQDSVVNTQEIKNGVQHDNQLINTSLIDPSIEQINDSELKLDNSQIQQPFNKTTTQNDANKQKAIKQNNINNIIISFKDLKYLSTSLKDVKIDLQKAKQRLKQNLSKVNITTLETKFHTLLRLLQQQKRQKSSQTPPKGPSPPPRDFPAQNQIKPLLNTQLVTTPRYMQPTVSRLLKVNGSSQLNQQKEVLTQSEVNKDTLNETQKLFKQQKILQKQILTLQNQIEEWKQANRQLIVQNEQQQAEIIQITQQLQQKTEELNQLDTSLKNTQNQEQKDLRSKYKDVTLVHQEQYKNSNIFLNIPEEMQKHFHIMYYQIFHIDEVNSFIIDQHTLIKAYTTEAKQIISLADYMIDEKYAPVVNQINSLGKVYLESANIIKRYEYIKILIQHLLKNDKSISQMSMDIEQNKVQFKNLTYNRLSKDINKKLDLQLYSASKDQKEQNVVKVLIKNSVDELTSNIQTKINDIMGKYSFVSQKLTILEKQVLLYIKNLKLMKQKDQKIAKINKEAAKSQEAYKKAVKIM